jgi:hypothetical protein
MCYVLFARFARLPQMSGLSNFKGALYIG